MHHDGCKVFVIHCMWFVNADQLFLILYKELYYRHVYARVQVNIYVALWLQSRFVHSWC